MLKIDLDKNKKYILACSYGPDSMALFDLLLKNNYDFVVCFLNYKTRAESDIEEEKITTFCKVFSKKLYKKISDLKDKNVNFEALARKARYDFFVEIAKKEKIKDILIAHHLDDLVETYYLQKKSNRINEFLGLTYRRLYVDDIYLVRPLLCYEKKEILDYCKENSIDYSIDYTNFENIHQRNILRNKELINLSKKDKLNIFNLCKEKNEFLNNLYSKIDNDGMFLNIDIIDSLNVDDKNRAGFRFLKNNGISIVKKHDIDALYKLCLNKTYKLNNKIIGFCYTFYVILNNSYSILYDFKVNKIPNCFGFDLRLFLEKYSELKVDDIRIVNLSKFDRIQIKNYQKSLDNYLKEIHLPKPLRSIWPCVVDKNNNLIYFPRFQENYQIRHDIFNIDIKNFLTTFNEEILD